jgi:hypothetical protein
VSLQHREVFECGDLLAAFGAYYCFGILKLRIFAASTVVVKMSLGVHCE